MFEFIFIVLFIESDVEKEKKYKEAHLIFFFLFSVHLLIVFCFNS